MPALLDRRHTELILPSARLKGSFLAGLMFLPSLLAIADEVIEQSFRNASIDGGEVTSWVIHVISSAHQSLPLFTPKSRPPLAPQYLMQWSLNETARAVERCAQGRGWD